MRLKSMDGPLSVHNGNNSALLNSPKRINTLQNSNVVTSGPYHHQHQQHQQHQQQQQQRELNEANALNANNGNVDTTTESALIGGDGVVGDGDTNLLGDNVAYRGRPNAAALGRWRASAGGDDDAVLVDNRGDGRRRRPPPPSTLAGTRGSAPAPPPPTATTPRRRADASSVCSESSPDDSLLDYEDAHQSCSSVDASPQEEDEEDRGFDVSDSESISDDVNLSQNEPNFQRRGIVNPNYPGFQHLAHTLDYGIKTSSDTDLTDDDFDCEPESKYVVDSNNANNNNNNNNNEEEEEETEYPVDKIDSVNRLDSVENIQKVFYDKTVLNIPLESEQSTSNSNQISDDDDVLSPKPNHQVVDEPKVFNKDTGIIGDLEKEIVQELDRIGIGPETPTEKPVREDLEEAAKKLSETEDLEPTASKYGYEPNVEQPFNKETPASENLERGGVDAQKESFLAAKLSDAFLSEARDRVPRAYGDGAKMFNNDLARGDAIREDEERAPNAKRQDSIKQNDDAEKFCKEEKTKDEPEKDEDSAVARKKEKAAEVTLRKKRDYAQQMGSLITIPRRELGGGRARENANRRSLPAAREKKRANQELFGSFDVYNIETAMPKIDLEAIELHLRAAREEERRRRTDREEIRRRLAMGSEDDYYNDRPGRKPSLQSRLQSGMNLQICFMNETVSDTESPSSDSECATPNPKKQQTKPTPSSATVPAKPTPTKKPAADEVVPQPPQQEKVPAAAVRPATLSLGQPLLQPAAQPMTETDFFARQARLQTEARMALAQAKEMARMQMEIERQKQKKSPITEMVRHSMEKVGIPFPEDRRRLSRQILTEMNVAQLQVIVNDLHTQIETLNESLVKFLMERDDLHMEQDSMLVDIEDLTRYLGAKEQSLKDQNHSTIQNNNIPPPSPAPSSPLAALNSSMKPHLHRIASLVKK